jgi:hypothetical protein
MTELVPDMPAPEFGDETSLGPRIGAGSRFKRFLCFVLIDVRCLSVPPEVCVPHVIDHYSRLYIYYFSKYL